MLSVQWDKSSNGFNSIPKGFSFQNSGLSTPIGDQESFTAKFLKIQSQGQVKEGSLSVTSFSPLEVVNEENKELSSLSSEKILDQPHLNRYIKVLQARSKEISWGKKQMDLLRIIP